MHARELHPASEPALREWPIDQRTNKADLGDDDPIAVGADGAGYSMRGDGMLGAQLFLICHFGKESRLSR